MEPPQQPSSPHCPFPPPHRHGVLHYNVLYSSPSAGPSSPRPSSYSKSSPSNSNGISSVLPDALIHAVWAGINEIAASTVVASAPQQQQPPAAGKTNNSFLVTPTQPPSPPSTPSAAAATTTPAASPLCCVAATRSPGAVFVSKSLHSTAAGAEEISIQVVQGTVATRVRHQHRVVLIAMEATSRSRRAVKWARRHILKAHDIVVLVTILEEPSKEDTNNFKDASTVLVKPEDVNEYNRCSLNSAHKLISDVYDCYLNELHVFPLIVPLTKQKKSLVGDIVCRAAKHLGAEMIIVGEHGHSAISKFFMGSVSQYVIERANCAVLLVKERDC
eukprot:GHVS01060795.1.p1 GENE.GHVS01060795.1~~GHVS01060795.1.p1  ORF type:complete len:370 (-),score=87.77 GHVS01060795.1:159-1151(-)